MWLASLAFAQPVADVPAGARAVTVFVCDRECEPAWRAYSLWASANRLPLLDFDAVAVHLRDDRLERWNEAIVGLRDGRASNAEIEAAWRALAELPYTVPEDDLFRVVLGLASVVATDPDPRYADRDWPKVAAAVSRHRSYNLPEVPTDTLSRYLDVSARPPIAGHLNVAADAPGARVFVDGRPAGEAPVSLDVELGHHRITVERPGRRTAWAAWIDVTPDTRVVAEVAGDDSNAALERLLVAAMSGVAAPDAEVASLTDWARTESLEWVRFVQVGHEGGDELLRVDPADPAWRTRDLYLDVARGRLSDEGPGPNAMLAAADPERFRVGAGLGYLHLAPRDHVTVTLAATYRLGRVASAEARVGLAHSAQPYYLYDDWIDPQVYPFSIGLRAGEARGGPYAGADVLAVIPYALGVQGRVGWEFAPSLDWRVGLEGRGGLTDKGWLAGAEVTLVSRR